MVNLDQMKLLEDKVGKAVSLIRSLSYEKSALKKELEEKSKRILELENLILVFKDDQLKIEQGIVNALNQLSAFESSSVSETAQQENASQLPAVNAAAQQENASQLPAVNAAAAESLSENKTPAAEAESTGTSSTGGLHLRNPSSDQTEDLQQDLNDMLGESSTVDDQSDIDKQMDIF